MRFFPPGAINATWQTQIANNTHQLAEANSQARKQEQILRQERDFFVKGSQLFSEYTKAADRISKAPLAGRAEAEIELEARKHELEKIVKTGKLHQQVANLLSKVIELSNEYVREESKYSESRDPLLYNRLRELKAQYELTKDDFITLENNLSRLEGREPRKVELNFILPAPPTGLRVVVH
ncbi:MAG: hypothetical protein HYX72_10070 [Acidobacteria bacterium]|nr:hypothetical protein [Acidobacteriota bacterium]